MLTTKDVENWLSPWPVAFAKGNNWRLEVMSLRSVGRLYAWWHDDKQPYRSIAWWARQAKQGKCKVDQHEIRSLARHYIPTASSITIICVEMEGRKVVVDGNHRAIAAYLVGVLGARGARRGPQHIGVVSRKGKRRKG